MAVLFEKTKLLTDKQFHYCPGCNHGIIHRLVAEVIDEMHLDGKVIGVAPVGCSVFAYDYFNCDMYEAAHGRAPAVATGVKRSVGKDTLVFTYQGDGDLASIGTAEIVHAAHRGDKITTIFVNNAIYGMTGGQMAPTTLIGQKATTCPAGREAALIQLDDWYYDYGKAIDDYYVYDDDSLDASDVRELQRELGVRIDDNVIVACDVTYQNGQDNDFYFEFVQVDGQWYLLFVVE